MKSLRPERARAFAAEFCENGFNASKAVRDIGITSNPKSAWIIGHRLLRNVVTIKAVEDHLKASKMSADEVLERLTKVARTNADFKGSDVVKAAELLGKGHKLFVDKIETSNTDNQSTVALALLSRRINKLAERTGKSLKLVEFELQTELSDRSDEDYSPDLDASVHPEVWPSGSLLLENQQDTAIEEIGDQ